MVLSRRVFTMNVSCGTDGLPAFVLFFATPQEKLMRRMPLPAPLTVSPVISPLKVVPAPLAAPTSLAAPAVLRAPVRAGGGLQVAWARHEDEVRAAQRLRYQVFALEMGACLHTPLPGHDMDAFDAFCEHLLVRDSQTQEVIGTYRVLTPVQAQRAGGLYSDTEFDLAPLHALRPRMVELGRSCVHAQHRHGGVVMALWGALAEWMLRNDWHTMVGCASVPMLHNGLVSGDVAASIWQQVQATHWAPEAYRVRPRIPLPLEQLDSSLAVEPPALVKGYLRLGARVLGPPAWDADFNTADLPMLMRLADLPSRYRRHFGAA